MTTSTEKAITTGNIAVCSVLIRSASLQEKSTCAHVMFCVWLLNLAAVMVDAKITKACSSMIQYEKWTLLNMNTAEKVISLAPLRRVVESVRKTGRRRKKSCCLSSVRVAAHRLLNEFDERLELCQYWWREGDSQSDAHFLQLALLLHGQSNVNFKTQSPQNNQYIPLQDVV